VFAGVERTRSSGLDCVAAFRYSFHGCLTRRPDALFELTDAVLCAEGPVSTLVGLSLVPEHRRGHGGLYDGLAAGRIEVARLRRTLAGLPLARERDGRIMLAVDVSPWLCSDAVTSDGRSFCHVYGRGKGNAQLIPGWPYSFVAALEPGATSWCALLDVGRLSRDDDATAVTATQIRDVIARLIDAGQYQPGDPDMVIVFDAGYDVCRRSKNTATIPRSRTCGPRCKPWPIPATSTDHPPRTTATVLPVAVVRVIGPGDG
jgi:hypothetical protein